MSYEWTCLFWMQILEGELSHVLRTSEEEKPRFGDISFSDHSNPGHATRQSVQFAECMHDNCFNYILYA